MAGEALTITKNDPASSSLHTQGRVRSYTLDWTTGSGGESPAVATERINGTLVQVVFVPDSGGTQPTDQYDVTLKDENNIDVLAGQGANLSNATATRVVPGVPFKDGTTTHVAPVVLDNALTLNVTNAGNSKGGQVILFVT